MKVLVLAIVALAIIVGPSCAGQSQVYRYHGFDFINPLGDGVPLGVEDAVVMDVYIQVGDDTAPWVKRCNDVPWDVTSGFKSPPADSAAVPLPANKVPMRMRGDVQAMIGGEFYEYSCIGPWKAYTPIGFSCDSVDE